MFYYLNILKRDKGFLKSFKGSLKSINPPTFYLPEYFIRKDSLSNIKDFNLVTNILTSNNDH